MLIVLCLFVNFSNLIVKVEDASFTWLLRMTEVLSFVFFYSYIKLSGPTLNNLIILGCVLIYISVYMIAIDGSRVDTDILAGLCMVRLPLYINCLKTNVESWGTNTYNSQGHTSKFVEDYDYMLIRHALLRCPPKTYGSSWMKYCRKPDVKSEDFNNIATLSP